MPCDIGSSARILRGLFRVFRYEKELAGGLIVRGGGRREVHRPAFQHADDEVANAFLGQALSAGAGRMRPTTPPDPRHTAPGLGDRRPLLACSDEEHQGVGQDAVVVHRIRGRGEQDAPLDADGHEHDAADTERQVDGDEDEDEEREQQVGRGAGQDLETGWATRASRGLIPIVAPIGTQTRAETTTMTLAKVIAPSPMHAPKAPNPIDRLR